MGKKISSLVLLVLFVCSASLFAKDVIRLTNGDWEPYLGKDLKEYGVISHIVTEAFEKEGIKVEYGFFPWKRAFKIAESGEWDGSVVWSRKPEREASFLYSDPVFYSDNVFFSRKDSNFDWKTFDDLAGKKMGGVIGYNYDPFKDVIDSGKVVLETASNEELNFKKLLAGRIDFFPSSKEVGFAVLYKKFKKKDWKKIVAHPVPYSRASYHLILNKKNPKNVEYLKKFNRGLADMVKKGKVEKYMTNSRKGKYLKSK